MSTDDNQGDQEKYPLTPADLEMLADLQNGRPVKRTPAQGIADMQARIEQIKAAIWKRTTVMSETDPDPVNESDLAEYKKELAEAEARLLEYQTLLQGQN
jgi:hypothetical protein